MEKELLDNKKDLLLKDLCARLPYRVKVQIKNVSKICTLEEIDCNPDEMSVAVEHENGELCGYDFERAKPYLFPLSSMTEEQKEEALPLLNNCDYYTIDGVIKWLDNHPIKFFDWCNKNHFDYRGLIEKGLAIDATGLNIY